MDQRSTQEKETPESPGSCRDKIEPIGESEAKPLIIHGQALEDAMSLPHQMLVVAVIAIAQFTTQVGLGQVLIITHVIGEHFDIQDPGILSWLIAGYSLTVGTFILFSGRLGDLFGWKKMVVIGYIWAAVWSLVLGLSWYSSYVLFIFARVMQGIGFSICLPNGVALLGAIYKPGPKKNMAFAVFGGCAPAGAIFGYLSSSLFNLAWWPWAFWSFSITLACTAACAIIAIPDPQEDIEGVKGLSVFQAARKLDILPATVGITALVLFNFAWNQAPIVGWQSPYIITTLILGVLLVLLFVYLELKISENPILPLNVFTSDNAFVLACIAPGWGSFGVFSYYTVQILQAVRGASPLLVTAYTCPVAITGLVAAVITGLLLARMQPAWVMLIAMCAFLTGNILIATLPPYQTYWGQIFIANIVTPFGMDMSFPAATLIISNSVEKRQQGIAASLVTTVVNYSISLGLGFAGTVETNIHHHGTTKEGLLRGYRAAMYMGVGLAGLAVAVALIFVLKRYLLDNKRQAGVEKEGDQTDKV